MIKTKSLKKEKEGQECFNKIETFWIFSCQATSKQLNAGRHLCFSVVLFMIPFIYLSVLPETDRLLEPAWDYCSGTGG